MHPLANAKKKVIGYKQSVKAIEKEKAQTVYLACDAEEKIRQPIMEACKDRGIPVIETDTMIELGKASGIQVGTAVAVILAPETAK